MESVDKLRDYGHQCCARIDDAIHDYCDEIEAEIEENCMLLPLDADGVPIRVGDEIECHANGYDGAFTVFAIGNDAVVGDHDIEWIARNPSNWFHVASFCTHVKPRTLEDVLADFVNSSVRVGCEDGISSEMRLYADGAAIARCAEEIRVMFGEVD